jgi:fatty-acyl-CoA synthase
MQHWSLLTSKIITHAEREHGFRELVTNTVEGGIHRQTWAQTAHRARQLAQALGRLGCKPGDRVATLAWNTHRHVEALYGIGGSGMVAHTINPRLFPEQIGYIANHAEDVALLFDISFIKLVEALAPRLPTIKHFIALTDADHLPESSLDLIAYEGLLAAEDGRYVWPELDENTACGLCYTSGTTGNPKGVLYSHRSTVLQTYASCMVDTLGIGSSDVVMPIAPMFHVNAWGIPFSSAAIGAKLVLNGPAFDAPTLHRLILDEGVTMTAAVPTVWLAMLQHLEKTNGHLGRLKSVVIGGSAAPRMMIEAFQTKYGAKVHHAWGMTEMSPLGTVGTLTPEVAALPHEQQLDMQCKQGRAIFGVELTVKDPAGQPQPRDGQAFGHLKVRGPWIIDTYFRGDGGHILDDDGYFDTGDVSTIDGLGYMQITDRAKDVIKSGGEWISSIDLENIAVGHPAVLEAAVIGVFHPKWDERPLLILVKKPGAELSKQDMLDYLSPRIAKWWTPDDVVFVDQLPHTATGKLLKTALREQFKDYRLPTIAA